MLSDLGAIALAISFSYDFFYPFILSFPVSYPYSHRFIFLRYISKYNKFKSSIICPPSEVYPLKPFPSKPNLVRRIIERGIVYKYLLEIKRGGGGVDL